MDKPWKIILLLAGIFVAGATTGSLVAVRVNKEKMGKSRSLPVEQWAPNRLRMLSQRLELTPAQMERLRPILRRDMEDLARIRSQSVTESRRIIDRMEKDIADQLTPGQKAEYEKVKQQTEERFRRMMQEREQRGGKGRPGGSGPDGPRRRFERAPGNRNVPPPEPKDAGPKPPGGG